MYKVFSENTNFPKEAIDTKLHRLMQVKKSAQSN